MAKTEEKFWDDTQEVGVIAVNDRKRVEVTFNMKEDADGEENWYVSLATQEYFQRKTKGETTPSWRFTKNATFPMDVWHEISTLINDNIEVE